MSNNNEEPEVYVRGSAEHREYMRHHGGWLKAVVNGLEDNLSIAGRSMLLLFIIYTTIKGGMLIAHQEMPFWLDIIMLALQVSGLEGSIPGLSRLREAMLTQNRQEDAKAIQRAIYSSRTLNFFTGLEIVLASTTSIGGFDMTEVNNWYGRILLLIRLVMITGFLIAMAKMEKKAPRIISQEEYDKEHTPPPPALPAIDTQAEIAEAVKKLASELKAEQSRMFADLQQQFAGVQSQTPTIDYQAIAGSVLDILEPRLSNEVRMLQADLRQQAHLFSLLDERVRRLDKVELNLRQIEESTHHSPAQQQASNGFSQEAVRQGNPGMEKIRPLHVVEDRETQVVRLWNEDRSRSTQTIAAITGVPKSTVAYYLKPHRDQLDAGETPSKETTA